MYYHDAWHHADEHDPLVSEDDRGYDHSEDPLDDRFLYVYPIFGGILFFWMAITAFAIIEPNQLPEAALYRAKITRDYVHEELEKKNTQLNELKEQEQALLDRLNKK